MRPHTYIPGDPETPSFPTRSVLSRDVSFALSTIACFVTPYIPPKSVMLRQTSRGRSPNSSRPPRGEFRRVPGTFRKNLQHMPPQAPDGRLHSPVLQATTVQNPVPPIGELTCSCQWGFNVNRPSGHPSSKAAIVSVPLRARASTCSSILVALPSALWNAGSDHSGFIDRSMHTAPRYHGVGDDEVGRLFARHTRQRKRARVVSL